VKRIKKHGARKTITTDPSLSLSGSDNFYESKNYKLKEGAGKAENIIF
jgi:hypothetical protein